MQKYEIFADRFKRELKRNFLIKEIVQNTIIFNDVSDPAQNIKMLHDASIK